MIYEVRRGDGQLVGHIQAGVVSSIGSVTFPLRPDGTQDVDLLLAEFNNKGNRYLAFNSLDLKTETLRRIPGFVEYSERRYKCNCGWTGPLRETRMLGAIGQLCPMCRKTTTEQ